jgi:Protein of unknown function (DUF2924)
MSVLPCFFAARSLTLRASPWKNNFSSEFFDRRLCLVHVVVLADGFAWNGQTYDSLTKIAFAITGTVEWSPLNYHERPVRPAWREDARRANRVTHRRDGAPWPKRRMSVAEPYPPGTGFLITRRVLLLTGVEDMTTRREEQIVVQLVAWITMMLAIAAGAMTMFWLV